LSGRFLLPNLYGRNGEHAQARGRAAARARDVETMALILVKLATLALLTILTFGVFPDRRRGAVIAIATCVAAAVVLHFVAP
jgi:hypothetical protein